MKRILMLTQWFDPELNMKGLSFARELRSLGYDIQVLTGFPNYPGGKVYPGYKIKLFQKDIMDGIPVFRVPLYPSHDQRAFGRFANYSSFALAASLIGPFGIKRPDVIYAYHPPATVGLPAWLLSGLYRAPLVYDIQDLWPDTLTATGMVRSRLILSLVDQWCRFIYARAAKIVVLSPGFKSKLIERGVPEAKIEVVYNWCDESRLGTVERDEALGRELGMANRFNVLFPGTMGKAQALEAVLEAAALLRDKLPAVQFVLAGGGIEVTRLKAIKDEKGLANVLFLPYRPIDEMNRIFGLADVLLVHLKNSPLFEITIPGKTQTCLAAGRPVLMGVKGNAAELVEKARAGLICRPQDPLEIASAVESFYRMSPGQRDAMGRNGKDFYHRELSLERGVKRFDLIFKSVIS
ncbi:MAG: glycosyltransferase family 4 protein [Candidatus Omnitrophota bacterium]